MRRVDVAVVGAGIIGASVALRLRERGFGTVVVLERSGVNAGASGVQPGGVRRQWGTREHCQLARESYAYYADFGRHVGVANGPRLDPCGYLFTAHSAQKLDELAANVELQRGLDIPSELIDPARVAEIVPGLDIRSLTGAAWCATDGYFDLPQAVVELVAQAAWRAGAELELGEVLGLFPDDRGWTVRRAGGDIAARHVVLAAGYESRALAAPCGIELPIERERRFVFLSAPLRERLLEPLLVAAERRFAAKQLANGRVLAGDLGASGDSAADAERWRATVRAGVEELAPILSFVDFDLLIDGVYDLTPDHGEILGPVEGLPGLWLATGFSGHGFMMAPAVARALADWIEGEDPGEAATSFVLERFAHGVLRAETQVV